MHLNPLKGQWGLKSDSHLLVVVPGTRNPEGGRVRHGAPTGGDVAYSEPRRAKCANGSGGWLPQPVTMTLTGKHTFLRYAFLLSRS